MSLGVTEIILILVVILLLFGGKRIPEIARALGRASYEYKKAKNRLLCVTLGILPQKNQRSKSHSVTDKTMPPIIPQNQENQKTYF